MYMQPPQWRKVLESSTESELETMEMPPGLPGAMARLWQRDREDALARFRPPAAIADTENSGVDEPRERSLSDERRALEAALSALESDELSRPAAVQSEPSQQLEIPKGSVADLLERQIGICAALIGNVADHVAHDPSDPSRYHLMDRVSSMLSSSATAARVVGQLRGIASETKQTFVKKVEGKREGGVPQT